MLIRLLETLNSDYRPDVWKLYIADNGSTDGTREWLEELEDDGKQYHIEYGIWNDNIGYSAAINQLASYTDSEYLCAVNADTWFTTEHVSQVQRSFEAHPKAGVIGVKQLDEQSRIRHGGIFWEAGTNPIHRGWSQTDANDVGLHDTIQCWTVSGSIYYVRRKAWDECSSYEPYKALFPEHKGAFLPTPHYFEETFCSQLMHHLGWEVWYDGSVDTAGHSWMGSTEQGKPDDRFAISRQIYIDACNALGIPHECN